VLEAWQRSGRNGQELCFAYLSTSFDVAQCLNGGDLHTRFLLGDDAEGLIEAEP